MPLPSPPRFRLHSWRVPRWVELVDRDGEPALDFGAGSAQIARSAEVSTQLDQSANILAGFLKLESAGPRAALAFARRYGPLRLDSIGAPSGRSIENRAGETTRPARLERVARWQFYSRLANAVLDLSAALHRQSEIPETVWEPIVAGWREAFGHSMPWWPGDAAWKGVSPESARSLRQVALSPSSHFLRRNPWPAEPSPFLAEAVAGLVNWWLQTGQVRPSLQWARPGPLVAPGLEVEERWKERGHQAYHGRRQGPVLWAAVRLAPGVMDGPQWAIHVGGAWGALGVALAEAVFIGANERQEFCEPGRHWFKLEEGDRRRRPGVIVCCKVHRNQARGLRKARQTQRERAAERHRNTGGARRRRTATTGRSPRGNRKGMPGS